MDLPTIPYLFHSLSEITQELRQAATLDKGGGLEPCLRQLVLRLALLASYSFNYATIGILEYMSNCKAGHSQVPFAEPIPASSCRAEWQIPSLVPSSQG